MTEESSYAETPALRLVVQGTEEEFPLAADAVTIGSGADNTIILSVSPLPSAGQWYMLAEPTLVS